MYYHLSKLKNEQNETTPLSQKFFVATSRSRSLVVFLSTFTTFTFYLSDQFGFLSLDIVTVFQVIVAVESARPPHLAVSPFYL